MATTELVLERLPSGEYAWLRSEEPAEDCDALYTITDSGREYLTRLRAQEWLFGREHAA